MLLASVQCCSGNWRLLMIIVQRRSPPRHQRRRAAASAVVAMIIVLRHFFVWLSSQQQHDHDHEDDDDEQHDEDLTTTRNNPISSSRSSQSSTFTAQEEEDEEDARNSRVRLQHERQLRKIQHAKKVGLCIINSADDLDVVYLDDDIVIVNKPSGVLTVPGVNQHASSLLDVVYNVYGHQDLLDQDPAKMIVHRLDMDTSGLVIFARKASVAKTLHALFRGDYDYVHHHHHHHHHHHSDHQDHPKSDNNHNSSSAGKRNGMGRRRQKNKQQQSNSSNSVVKKEYQALVVGDFASSSSSSSSHNIESITTSSIYNTITTGLIDLPLQRDHENFPFMRVATPASEVAAAQAIQDLRRAGYQKLLRKDAKASQTKFHVVSRNTIPIVNHNNNNNNKISNSRDHHHHDDKDDNNDVTSSNSSLVYTHLRLIPMTGRTHQLRVHCAAAGYSIIGDPTYSLFGEASPQGGLSTIRIKTALITANPLLAGQQPQRPTIKTAPGEASASSVSPPSLQAKSPCPLEMQMAWTKFYPPNDDNCPMCLHASKLSFPHPITNEIIQVQVPAPFAQKNYFENYLTKTMRKSII